MSNIKELLGKRIREIRKQKKMTQETLAEYADIEIASLSNIENGKNYPNFETLNKISNAFNILPYELYVFEHLDNNNHTKLIEEMVQSMTKDKDLTNKLYLAYKALK